MDDNMVMMIYYLIRLSEFRNHKTVEAFGK